MSSEVIVIIADARLPEISMNKELLRMAEKWNKPVVYVYNKIDLVTKGFLDELKRKHKRSFFVSAANNKGIGNLRKGLFIAGKRTKSDEPKVGMFGYPNVGKSAIINALARRGKAKVSSVAGTTRGIQWIKLGDLRILDSPGVIPFQDKSQVKLALIGAKNPQKFDEPEIVAYGILQMIVDRGGGNLKRVYRASDGEMDELLLEIGRNKGFLIKGGRVDERRTSIKIIDDWQKGVLRV